MAPSSRIVDVVATVVESSKTEIGVVVVTVPLPLPKLIAQSPAASNGPRIGDRGTGAGQLDSRTPMLLLDGAGLVIVVPAPDMIPAVLPEMAPELVIVVPVPDLIPSPLADEIVPELLIDVVGAQE